MRVFPIALVAVMALAGCGGGEAELDIVSIEPTRSPMLPADPGGGPDPVALDVTVRAGQLRAALGPGGAFDLLVFDCAAPDGPGETVPVYFGGEPITGISGRQVSDNPDMLVLLNAAVPRSAAEIAQPCARFVGRPGLLAPDITSRPTPLPRD